MIWGAIHGGMLGFERALGKKSFYHRMPDLVKVAVTFAIVCISWVFFRAESLGSAWRFLLMMFSGPGARETSIILGAVIYTKYHLLCFCACSVVVWFMPQAWNFTQRITPWKAGACLTTFVISVMFLWTQTVNPFLYYQF